MLDSLLSSFRSRFSRTRTAFVLSGGGNLGAVQVGMLRALVEAGITPDLIVGCSVGAINGAAYAADPGIRGVHRLERIWARLADGDPDIMPNRRLVPLALQMTRRGTSLHTQDRLRQLLEDELPAAAFQELTIPLSCIATDLDRAAEYWFDDGPLVPALLASAALPGVYPPVHLSGSRYFDGGVVSEVPVHRAVELGATTIYLLHVGHLDERTLDEVRRPFDVLAHAYWTARANRLDEELTRVPPSVELIRLPAGSTPRLRFDDFTQGRELARLSYEASIQYLRTGRAPTPIEGPESEELDEEPAELDRDDLEGPTLGFDA